MAELQQLAAEDVRCAWHQVKLLQLGKGGAVVLVEYELCSSFCIVDYCLFLSP